MKILTIIPKILNTLQKIPHDRLLHSFYGTLIYILVAFISPILAVGVVSVIAVFKEIYDESKYGGFDIIDVLYTIAIPYLLYIQYLYFKYYIIVI